ncbi:hypothetical protein FUAX_46170 (plasmid) [Fulvitalea axinellae]|uniref:Uncharacterized protein n=1 Tax=Fulvitalea axinellae TaxID=1182444 RepID=A0AAU9CSB7_9BACT|nr:hypothetical protein FUAX_46170 [Fulvitalea axinellae]
MKFFELDDRGIYPNDAYPLCGRLLSVSEKWRLGIVGLSNLVIIDFSPSMSAFVPAFEVNARWERTKCGMFVRFHENEKLRGLAIGEREVRSLEILRLTENPGRRKKETRIRRFLLRTGIISLPDEEAYLRIDFGKEDFLFFRLPIEMLSCAKRFFQSGDLKSKTVYRESVPESFQISDLLIF